MKLLVYSPHVKERMVERTISRKQIREAIGNPEITLPCIDIKRRRVMRRYKDKTLDVIYIETKNSIIIITAVWITRDRRHRK